jgi:hypothetical protein
MVCANRSRRVHISRAAHGRDFSPERFGNLDRKRTHTTRRAINQNLLASLDPSLVTKTLKGRDCRHWYGRCALKRYVGWLQRQFIFNRTGILGKGPKAHAEHLVARFELRYVPSNPFNLAGHISSGSAGSCDLWFAQPEQYANDVRPASHQAPVKCIDGSRANSYQDLIILGGRFCYLRELKNIRGSVFCVYDRSHKSS